MELVSPSLWELTAAQALIFPSPFVILSFVATDVEHWKGCLSFIFILDKGSRVQKDQKLAWKISKKSLVLITDATKFLENILVTEHFLWTAQALDWMLYSLHAAGFPQADEIVPFLIPTSLLGKPQFSSAHLAQDTKLVSHTVRSQRPGC